VNINQINKNIKAYNILKTQCHSNNIDKTNDTIDTTNLSKNNSNYYSSGNIKNVVKEENILSNKPHVVDIKKNKKYN